MNELILLALDDTSILPLLSRAIRAIGYQTITVQNRTELKRVLQEKNPALTIIGEHLNDEKSTAIIEDISTLYPTSPIIFLATENSAELTKEVLRAGVSAYLKPPMNTNEIVDAIQSSLKRARRMGDWVRLEVTQSTTSLEKRVSELEVLLNIGRDITSILELDHVLKNVVSAAVELTQAEEGSLLLLDEESNELYMRAGHNFEDSFADSFRLSVSDSLAGQVITTGEPVSFNKDSLHKIQTAYLIQALIYVPLKIKDRIIGVLGVDNRQYQAPFSRRDTLLLSILAEYAAVAIENANIYKHSDDERLKFEAVLSNMDDALLILDQQERIQLVNEAMCAALGIQADNVYNQPLRDVITQRDLLNLLERKGQKTLRYHEINLDDDRVFSAQYTPIHGVGAAITMQDISYLKELNRLKDDFVHTVSHDLRSPLTAVLGYTELLERVGPVNEQQAEFIRRIQGSVQDITVLINDLLDLGRIEAGFDTHREAVHLDSILSYTLSNVEELYKKKNLIVETDIASDLSPMRGNPVRLRQMCDNLINNAIKYTPEGKKVCIRLHNEGSEIILEVADRGSGIPREDQPRIFEKFYRARNVSSAKVGSGLGLAIVKTIVESHQGRIWFESKLDEGSTFFVVLPSST